MLNLPNCHNVIFVLYDLPCVLAKDKKIGANFRKQLIRLGYTCIQKSVYVKLVRNAVSTKSELRKLKEIAPIQGDVKALPLSLNQFKKIVSLVGEPFNMEVFSDDMVLI